MHMSVGPDKRAYTQDEEGSTTKEEPLTEIAPVGASHLSPEDIESGRHWSAKVLLMSGVNARWASLGFFCLLLLQMCDCRPHRFCWHASSMV